MTYKFLKLLIASVVLLGLNGCILEGHNQAPSEPVNVESERIYGESREAPPRQLNNTYPDDETGETLERVTKIQQEFFPE